MSPEEKLNRLLTQKRLKIAVAESCTGGLIATRITDISGSSNYFEAGLVTYSNGAKELFLSVPHDVIASRGAVSAAVALKMAEGVRDATGADIGLSVTGIAGPEGGSDEKPVGTVYIGLAVKGRSFVERYGFDGDRPSIRRQTADAALNLVVDYIEGRPE
jgi:nicotinamide-nucleotide amidase